MTRDDRPWMIAIERQFQAYRYVQGYIAVREHVRARRRRGEPPLRTFDDVVKKIVPGLDNPTDESHTYWLHQSLRVAAPFSWTPETTAAVAEASRTVRQDAPLTREDLPTASGWWYFGASGPIVTIDTNLTESVGVAAHDLRQPMEALVFHTLPDAVYVAAFVGRDPHRPAVPCVSFSWSLGDDLAHVNFEPGTGESADPAALIQTVQTLARVFLAGCVWLRQRVVSASSGPIERHRRKQLARDYSAPLVTDVKVIHLRRTLASPPAESRDSAIEWHCRWIVSGHWRNQPYKEATRLIYINPYVKGPEDQPLKVPSHTIYRVDR